MRLPVLVLALTTAGSASLAARCTTDQFASFREATIAGPVNKCKSATEVDLAMPPVMPLTEMQRVTICDERTCKDMIAALDDMEVPRCVLLVDGKNVTLQATLDRFTTICDGPRTPVPVKKLTPKKAATNAASSETAPLTRAVVAIAVVAFTMLAAAS